MQTTATVFLTENDREAALYKALNNLPAAERSFILEQADRLTIAVRSRSPKIAFTRGDALEVLYSLGLFLNGVRVEAPEAVL